MHSGVTEAARFYQERDRRTIDFVQGDDLRDFCVSVHAGHDVCSTQPGQLLLVALANQLARVHRRVRFSLAPADAPLLTKAICDKSTLGSEIQTTLDRIDPYGSFDVTGRTLAPAHMSLGVGADVRPDLSWYVSFDRSNAVLRERPSSTRTHGTGDLRGAGLAAVLGAATATKVALGLGVTATKLSAWNLASGECADPGPCDIPEIDVGRGLIIGAGAVGSSAVYWLRQWGHLNRWTVVDNDVVKLHNTNRSLLFFPDDAGWPDQERMPKVQRLCDYLSNPIPVRAWYDNAGIGGTQFDTVLVLANERDVRTSVSWRNDPIQLQATTARSWGSQLHRHIVGRDDCVRCRMADVKEPRFECSEVDTSTTEQQHRGDAALPFLSAASGLMLVSALQRLQLGEFGKNRINNWWWDFQATRKMHFSGYRECRRDCRTTLPVKQRKHLTRSTCWSDAPWLR